MAVWILLSIFFFVIMSYAWVKGLTIMRSIKPDWIVPFYFGLSAARFILALTIVLLYLRYAEHTQEEAIIFCLTFSLMYIAMIIVSVKLKH